MSNWKVIKTRIEIFEHPTADKLQLGKVGTYQVVVQKGLYDGGEEVIFVPEKSILTGVIKNEYKNYLAGSKRDRVKSVRLRNELSCGIIIPNELIIKQCGKSIEELDFDTDLSEILGISLYIPPVPIEMEGIAEPTEHTEWSSNLDVEQFGVYSSNFIASERIVVTEKLHGSQVNVYALIENGEIKHKWISTKRYNRNGLHILESDTNFYWKAVRDINLFENILSVYKDQNVVVQIFGEAIPCQGMKYGFTEPTMKIFDVRLNAQSVPYDTASELFKKHWVPVLYDGLYENINDIKKLCKGMEQVSGKELHIKEGIVIRPYIDRRATDGTRLLVKVINPKYKETGEEFS